jgi:protein involved in polysaccharide export with SLBB domain
MKPALQLITTLLLICIGSLSVAADLPKNPNTTQAQLQSGNMFNVPSTSLNPLSPISPAPSASLNQISPILPSIIPYNRSRIVCEPFGCFLFNGDFATEKSPVFSPEYVVAVGDKISIKIWGSIDYEQVHIVDAQGNIFLPRIGPVRALGVKNRELTATLLRVLRTVYTSNVGLYAGLLETQPVIVYVTGGVVRPGAYGGTSANSLMYYLDRAGGIDPDSGSYLDLAVIRGSQKIRTFNLYDFTLKGEVPAFQFSDGDTILVGPRRQTVKVEGLVSNPYRFEFNGETILASDLLAMAAPRPDATHLRITRNQLKTRDVEYQPLKSAASTIISNGDLVTLLSDKSNGTISIRIEGEHLGAQEVALPYGTRLSEVLKQIKLAPTADKNAVQLFRVSVAARQKEMLMQSLRTLEVSVLTARSSTAEEAKLRKDEADLFMQWIERAKDIQPRGQVVITGGDPSGIILENGDTIRIPSDNALVMVSGEVLFPSTIAFRPDMSVSDAIDQSGGYSQGKSTSRIVILRRDGSYQIAGSGETLKKGDEVLVLPKVETKFLQFTKDIMTILYQIAVSAAVVLRL